eukprot:TRINITY_DN2331_c0_g1_i1.p1 TRINITY_DN2331_c0_g1~~TRINITY_DN2331_c0_g1_i1.p1  ORF type:complete len:625 (+),score=129.27 TRINITY_DN2331_c0_g1_i1:44-1876(+)
MDLIREKPWLRWYQDPPALGNLYLEDTALVELLHRVIPSNVLSQVEPEFAEFGRRVTTNGDVLNMCNELIHSEPKLTQIDRWGRKVDEIHVRKEWYQLHDVAATEGIVAHGYERKYGKYSRVIQYVKLYLFQPSSANVSCPLAMTDGAARLIEVMKDTYAKEGLAWDSELEECYQHIISRDPAQFWTSGQWMTERTGGSDVGNSQTIAVKEPNSKYYRLYGYKFFTSATTANVSFALARIVDSNGNSVKGSRGLSLFKVNLRKEGTNELNNMIVHKMKIKLGTKSLPTAEMELNGTPALLVGQINQGVKHISSLFNVTRLHTCIASATSARRILALARDYAHRREAFGKKIAEQPLHVLSLARMEVGVRGLLHFAFDLAQLLGEDECEPTPSTQVLLRLLTPVGKAFTTRTTLLIIGEGIECFGGYGYMEDTNIPYIYREAQVNSIWEGTTNVMALDVLRSITKEPESLGILMERIASNIGGKTTSQKLQNAVQAVQNATKSLNEYFKQVAGLLKKGEAKIVESGARDLTFTIGRVYTGSLLIHHAIFTNSEVDAEVANRWCTDEPLVRLSYPDKQSKHMDSVIGLDLDKNGKPRGCGEIGPDGHPRAKY